MFPRAREFVSSHFSMISSFNGSAEVSGSVTVMSFPFSSCLTMVCEGYSGWGAERNRILHCPWLERYASITGAQIK